MLDYKFLKIRGAVGDTAGDAPEQPDTAVSAAQLPSSLIPAEVLELVPEAVARNHLVLPLGYDGETVTMAAADADDIALTDRLRFLLAKNVRLIGVPRTIILQAIERNYGPSAAQDRVVRVTCDRCGAQFSVNRAAVGKPARCPSCARIAVPTPAIAVSNLVANLSDADLGVPVAVSATMGGRPGAGWGRYLAESIRDFKKGMRGLEGEDDASGYDATEPIGGEGMLFYTVEEGQRALMRRLNGTMKVVVGPQRIWRGWNTFQKMDHYVAHPDEFLIVRFRDGRQEHLPGPAEMWFDPRVHLQISKENALQIAAKEAVVVYCRVEGTATITRRVEYGPALFVPRPGEWLHTFSWHASRGGHKGVQKEPNALVFQKLWLMPDQMYHDVGDVRTADDAVLMIRLMIFFELIDIDRMLEATHDPIGDFVNAATSDVVAFAGRHDFEEFKHNTSALNELATYQQLLSRAAQCGYRINKVVYRGYGAAEALQQMHDQAIEARTRLQLDRATEQQAQDLENYKLDCQLARASKRRGEQVQEVEHDLALTRTRQEAELRQREALLASERESERLGAELRLAIHTSQNGAQRQHLEALRSMGVDLTAFLTQARADQVIEFRGESRPHVHLDRLGKDGSAKGKT
jgi:hypothetical protein